MKFTDEVLARLHLRKNLLAFSGGADSTALFYLLLEHGIGFDIAIVNYRTRSQSDAECAFAESLAAEHGLKCHLLVAEPITENFEHNARKVRYDFFAALCASHAYANLLTAHQLDDRLEWFFMQLTKGAGLNELMGMQAVEAAEHYTLLRPLLATPKSTLLSYLASGRRRWFEDESNRDERYRRNYFRNRFSEPMLREFAEGVSKSFAYLDQDRELLHDDTDVTIFKEMRYFKTRANRRATLIIADNQLKQMGYLMREGDKNRLKEEDCTIVGRKFVVAITEHHTLIAPYETAVMPKPFKEQCRLLGIPPKLRGYLFNHPEVFEAVSALFRIQPVHPHGERRSD